jgi:glucose uptake protein
MGAPVSYGEYFSGSFKTHCVGILGGIVWALGTSLSYIAAGKAGAAISYALGQGCSDDSSILGRIYMERIQG